jgi:hypothetical protein
VHGAFNELLGLFDIRCEENGREIRMLGAVFRGKNSPQHDRRNKFIPSALRLVIKTRERKIFFRK